MMISVRIGVTRTCASEGVVESVKETGCTTPNKVSSILRKHPDLPKVLRKPFGRKLNPTPETCDPKP